jgi:hypothetical protein
MKRGWPDARGAAIEPGVWCAPDAFFRGEARMRSYLVALAAALALTGCGKSGGPPANATAAPPSPAANVAVAAAGGEAQSSEPGVSNPAAPAASGPSAVDIHFQRGANCWKYVGAAATFNGRFAAGQRVDISSTGEQANGDGTRTWYETKPRSVYIAPPNGQLLSADADGYFTIPADGAYQITFDPMSMVGAPGVMIVCTL